MHSVPQCVGSVWPLFSEDKRLWLATSTVDRMVCVHFRLQSTKLIQSTINRLPFFCKLFLNLLHVGCEIDFCFMEINTEKEKKKKSNDKIHRSIRTNKTKCSFIFLFQRSKSQYTQIVKKALCTRMFNIFPMFFRWMQWWTSRTCPTQYSSTLCLLSKESLQFSSAQSLSLVRLFETPWVAACQASLSITNSRSLLKLTPIELVMPSSHLILCRPFLLLPGKVWPT